MLSPDEEVRLLVQCAAHLTPLVSTVRAAYAKNGRAAAYSWTMCWRQHSRWLRWKLRWRSGILHAARWFLLQFS